MAIIKIYITIFIIFSGHNHRLKALIDSMYLFNLRQKEGYEEDVQEPDDLNSSTLSDKKDKVSYIDLREESKSVSVH